MMKCIYIFILLVMLPLFILAQNNAVNYYQDDFTASDYRYKHDKTYFKKSKKSFLNEDNFDFRFTTSTSYVNFFGNNLFSTYLIPEIRYKLNNKIAFSGGVIASLNYFPNFTFPNSENSIAIDNKMYSYYLFAKGEYQVNDRLKIRTTTIFSPESQLGQGQYSYNNIGFDIKIADRAYFSADFSVRRTSRYPSFYDPFGGYFDNFHSRSLGSSLGFEHFSQW